MERMVKLILILFLGVLSITVSAQQKDRKSEPKSEMPADSIRRFPLADGKFIGANPNPPQAREFSGSRIKKGKATEESNPPEPRRIPMDYGKDTGVGSEYRSERYRSLEMRQRMQESVPKATAKNDTLPKPRIVLHDGKFVGAGAGKSKDQ